MDSRKSPASRSRSPRHRDHHHRHRSPARQSSRREEQKTLPYNARELTKHDLSYYRPMFALFLDIQKRIDIEDLAGDEVKGRWKSFVHKWNRGDLAEGWYDLQTLEKARRAAEDARGTDQRAHSNEHGDRRIEQESTLDAGPKGNEEEVDEDDDDDGYGPGLPGQEQSLIDGSASGLRSGPTVPTLDDIRSRTEDNRISVDAAREQRFEAMRMARKMERKVQRERHEEAVPRAEAGTRERQLEKKRELAASNRTFAASKEAGGDIDVSERDVMGGDDLGELKRMKNEQDRRKTEREIKREEILRARAAEREEMTQKMKAKEEKTMAMLKELARSRFGDGNSRPAMLSED